MRYKEIMIYISPSNYFDVYNVNDDDIDCIIENELGLVHIREKRRND